MLWSLASLISAFVLFLHVLSSDTLTHERVLGPLMAAHRIVISALME